MLALAAPLVPTTLHACTCTHAHAHTLTRTHKRTHACWRKQRPRAHLVRISRSMRRSLICACSRSRHRLHQRAREPVVSELGRCGGADGRSGRTGASHSLSCPAAGCAQTARVGHACRALERVVWLMWFMYPDPRVGSAHFATGLVFIRCDLVSACACVQRWIATS